MSQMDVDDEDIMVEKLADVTIEENENDIAGSGLFGFHSTKSAKSMLMRAFDSAPKSVERRKSKSGRTPKSGSQNVSSKSMVNSRTPSTSNQSRKIHPKVNTPRRLHARNKADDSSSEESSNEEMDEEELLKSSFKENLKDAKRYQKLRSAVEEYFLLHEDNGRKGGGRGPKTSNRTLARLGDSRPDALETRNLLNRFFASNPPNCYLKERAELVKDHENCFPKWSAYLVEGFNVLLYGLGSKYDLMQKFCEDQLPGEDYIIVRGFMPNVTIRNVLKTICEEFVDARFANKQIPDQLEAIQEIFNDEKSEDLFLIVHNIDGPLFRNEKAQTAFCGLASCKKIHVLASVDHVNAPLLWSSRQHGQLNWLWQDCTTFAPYLEETAFENSLLIQQGGTLMLSSLKHVMASLTQNAREIFLMIARYQLDSISDKSLGPYEGYSLEELYWKSRDACLVNNDVTLRAQLTEFKDHKLIRFKKAIDGTELVLIPLDDSSLQDFVTNFNDYVRN